MATFSENDLLAISQVLGHPNDGLTESELQSVLEICGISVERPWTDNIQALHKALKEQQTMDGHRRSVLAFLRVAMSPDRYGEDRDRFLCLRAQLNEQLLLCGLRVEEDGSLSKTESFDKEQVGLLRYMFGLIRGLDTD